MFVVCPQKKWEITTNPAKNPMPSWTEKSLQQIKSRRWITPPKHTKKENTSNLQMKIY